MTNQSIRSNESLIASIQEGAEHEYLFFWGHQPSKSGKITKTCFSQWFGSPFAVDGIKFLTAEHFMMAEKAKLFGDAETLRRVLLATDPAEAKALGRTVSGFDDEVWVKNRWRIVVDANQHKFSQNLAMREFLAGTENHILVEASPYDKVWGIGLKADSPAALHPGQWLGLNLLGYALMEVRATLAKNDMLR